MVSDEYLAKIRFAVRRSTGNKDVDTELTDIIEQARADMIRKGVSETVANDESDAMVLGAVRSFARWRFGIGGDDADTNHAAYDIDTEQLRKTAARAEAPDVFQ